MRIQNCSKTDATITMSLDEVIFLCRAISETFEAVSDSEFELRTGEKPERAAEIRQSLRDIRDRIDMLS